LNDIELKFDLILAGDTQHEKPEEFEKAWQRFGQQITHFGYVDDKENYSRLLHSGDIVVSTASYEFFCVYNGSYILRLSPFGTQCFALP
jgi:hypothetical protein